VRFNAVKNAGFPVMALFLAIVAAGCSREDQRAADTATRGTPKLGSAPLSGGRTGAWTYHSKEYDFSLQLPSAGWKERTKKQFIADFWCPVATGAPMLAGVISVKRQTREQFRAAVPQFKADADKGGDYLVKPTFQEGETASGNPYVYAALCEKGTAGGQFIYVATAAVWLTAKGITVTTIFEGQGQMRSKVFKAVEYSEFETAAKSICLSPR
jgi:hypothetical protein